MVFEFLACFSLAEKCKYPSIQCRTTAQDRKEELSHCGQGLGSLRGGFAAAVAGQYMERFRGDCYT